MKPERRRDRIRQRVGEAVPDKFKNPVRLLPNLITTASLSCGLLAIFYMVGQNHDSIVACWLIIAAAVLDSLDGAVARMTNSESEFGVQFDSLSDAIVFGATPAILIFFHLRGDENIVGKFAQLCCMLFTICGVLRLARFNTTAAQPNPNKTFTGMPIPGAAATVVSAYMVVWDKTDATWVVNTLPFLMLYLALAMVSEYEYHSPKSIDFNSPKPFKALFPAIFIVALLFVFKKHIWRYIEWIVFVVMGLYALSGPGLHYFAKWTGKGRQPFPEAPPDDGAGDEDDGLPSSNGEEPDSPSAKGSGFADDSWNG